MKKRAFFLDRDGTINVDHVYISDPNRIELIPGAREAIERIHRAGFLVVVVTNQSGVGRGIIAPKVLPKIHERLDSLLGASACIDDYRICTHRPEEDCRCRKPKASLVKDAVKELGIDLAGSVFVGDKLSDVATGKNSGCAYSILVRTGKGEKEEALIAGSKDQAERPDLVADDLAWAVDWALEKLA